MSLACVIYLSTDCISESGRCKMSVLLDCMTSKISLLQIGDLFLLEGFVQAAEFQWQNIASYPGFFSPGFVTCSTNTGEDLVKLIMCSDVLGVEWTCVTFLLYSFLSLKNITKTA